MNIIACHAGKLHPKARAALKQHAPRAELVYTGTDDFAYWREINSRWTGEQDLMILEQDIEIDEKTIPSFAACQEGWCVFGYFIALTEITNMMGCVKFSARFQRDYPIEMISSEPVAWDAIDTTISRHLKSKNVKPHVHGTVGHHHRYVVAMDYPHKGVYTWKAVRDGTSWPSVKSGVKKSHEIPEGIPVFEVENGERINVI